MNNTAFALMVAIPFLLIHAFLQARTSEIVDGLEAAKISFLNLVQRLQGRSRSRRAEPLHRSHIAMRVRRLRKQAAALEVTAFINLIVVLVPFLLSTAVFTRLAVIDLTLPAQNSGVEQLKVDDLQARDRDPPRRARGRRPHRRPDPAHRRSTRRRPRPGQALSHADAADQGEASRTPRPPRVLAEPDTSYDMLVQVMDAVRAGAVPAAARKLVRAELFPDISIGDAPVATQQGERDHEAHPAAEARRRKDAQQAPSST